MKTIWILRIGALLLLLFMAARPTSVRPDSGLPKEWAFLIDTSQSMRVKDPTERLGAATKKLQTLAKQHSSFPIFSFSDKADVVPADKLPALKPIGRKSDIAAAIKAALSEKNRRGAVIFTDGRHIGAEDPVSAAASAGRPLLLVGVGDKSLYKDVAVRSVQSPPFAFKNIPLSISATLSVVGYSGREISVRLREGDQVLAIQTLRAAGPDVETSVSFNWTPGRVGTRFLTVEASAFSDEATTLNNRKDLTLDVGRDRFRVLYICGEPGPEYGFLRHQFKSDPAVELVTFVILRNASNTINVPEAELSLIPFPTQDVLVNQMATFDLVVFEEFAYQQFGLMPTLMYAIRQKVLEGGSFLLVGGPTIFGVGSPYAIGGVKEMIPVEMGGSDVSYTDGLVKFIPKALSHPVLRLENSPEKNREVWEGLPPLEGTTLLTTVKEGATVLGSAMVNGREYPVLTVWKTGKGRVAALTSRTTWRWSMLDNKGNVSDIYQRFWKNMVLWLTHSDEFKSVRVAFEDKNVRVGEEQTLRVWSYDEYFKPLSDVDVHLQVTYPDGKKEELPARAETAGVFAASFETEQTGTHSVQAWVSRGGKRIGQDRVDARVQESHFEEEDLRPNFDLLRELARTTSGKFVPLDQFSVSVFDQMNADVVNQSGKKVLLWNAPWLFAAVIGLLAAEWVIRKKRGLP